MNLGKKIVLLLSTIVISLSMYSSVKLVPEEITWYFIGNGQPRDFEKIENEVNKYIQSKGLNATVKLQCFDWGNYNQKITNIIASGEVFDICFTSNWTNNYYNNVANGAFLELNDLLDKYAPKTKALLGSSFLAGTAINGKNYAIPANKEKAHNWGFLLRKDLVEKYKFDVSKIKSLADLRPLLKVIKENEPRVYPLEAIGGESPRLLLDWDKMLDDDIPVSLYGDNRDTKVIFELEAPETLALFKQIRSYYIAGYIRKDAAYVYDYNADEKAGKIFAMTKSLKPGKDEEMSNYSGQKWIQVDITKPVMSNRETMGSLQAISSTSKHPELAMKFLELFNTDVYLNNLINYGIKDVHYVMVSDNAIKAGPNNANYAPGTSWMFGNQFITYVYDNEDPSKWIKFEAYNASALQLKSLGFRFDPSNVLDEISACKSVWDEFMPILETGSKDTQKTMKEAIAKFKDAGVYKIVAEAQKQYDAFLAKQKK